MLRKLALPTLIAAFALAGCVAVAVPGPTHVAVASGPDYYDGYYDGAYGPFVDGYWGGDGAFWYMGGDRAFHRDEGGHFHREAGTGFNHVHGTGVHRDH